MAQLEGKKGLAEVEKREKERKKEAGRESLKEDSLFNERKD